MNSIISNNELRKFLTLDLYTARFRELDPTIAQWLQIDPRPNTSISPYAAMELNPILNRDFLGDTARVTMNTQSGQAVYIVHADKYLPYYLGNNPKYMGMTEGQIRFARNRERASAYFREVNRSFYREESKRNDGKKRKGEKLSLVNMYLHFQFGEGKPMTIDMSSINLSGTSQSVLGLRGMKINDVRPVNLFNAGTTNPAALAFGRVWMKYYGNNQFSIISDGSAHFDFSPIIDPNASWGRNAGNILGAMINYNLLPGTPFSPLIPLTLGGGYPVNFIGTTYIPPK